MESQSKAPPARPTLDTPTDAPPTTPTMVTPRKAPPPQAPPHLQEVVAPPPARPTTAPFVPTRTLGSPAARPGASGREQADALSIAAELELERCRARRALLERMMERLENTCHELIGQWQLKVQSWEGDTREKHIGVSPICMKINKATYVPVDMTQGSAAIFSIVMTNLGHELKMGRPVCW